jgi:hypothetical protein
MSILFYSQLIHIASGLLEYETSIAQKNTSMQRDYAAIWENDIWQNYDGSHVRA